MITSRNIGYMGIMSMIASGLLVRDDSGLSERPAQTNAVEAPAPVETKPSRQVRRQRERLAAKGRNDRFHPIMLGRSKYLPHIGKKQREKGAQCA